MINTESLNFMTGALLIRRWHDVLAQDEQYLVEKGVLETTGCRALSGLPRRESRRDLPRIGSRYNGK